MQKLMTSAALAAALATPALASELRVPTDGKSAAQVRADIVSASKVVCRKDFRDDDLGLTVYRGCVRDTVDRTVTAMNDRTLIAYNKAHPIRLASIR
ncbi:MAG: hypothetical protein ACM3W4_08280 [Ignavibacteriales bacterium]